MWHRKRPAAARTNEAAPPRLRTALREARLEAAERTGVVVDLRDADVARLEILLEALAPVFAEIPDEVDLFDPAISTGATPRLWIDAVAHVAMARDKRTYRFLHDTRIGRKVSAESPELSEIVAAVTRYVARRLVERERALGETREGFRDGSGRARRRRLLGAVGLVVLGMLLGVATVFVAAFVVALGLSGG